ncbi:hypothetical protein B0T25DRAFT_561813 [Lasiosphaeria hispida]|uniref:Uncharacterized protein n=1 Tax=Lasiosphaeria hispida TaxID=260671 RepID=A0AAJ0HU48_9PEZI|nr:hypothetical protein B0T25DRAFT_561813 [Lasiosphaeria hispida]
MSQLPEDRMSSMFSESPSAADWASISSTIRANSSQGSHASLETGFESPDPDHLQKFLGSNWASYLNAQHSSREMGAMRKTVDEHIEQLNTAITCLEQDAFHHQRLAAAATAEYKTMRDTVVSDLEKLKPLGDNLPRLQQEVRSSNEQTSAVISGLREELSILQERLEVVDEMVAQDTKAIQDKYRSALEQIEFLQGEIRELREDKVAMSKKMFSLGNRADSLFKIRQELPPEVTSFLSHIFSQREKLIGLLDRPNPEVTYPNEDQASEEIIVKTLLEPEHQIQNDAQDATASAETTPIIRPSPNRKRKASETPPREQALPPTRQDFPALLTHYRNEYRANPPGSDVAFVWAFLDDIENVDVSRHIQESLTRIIPARVGGRRLKNKDGRHYVNISDAITWKEFYTALRKISPRK